jgi:homoserine O-acetyltransferase
MPSTLRTRTALDFRLESGAVLPLATTAYRTLGRLNAAGDNAVLVLHGYTTGPAMLDEGANVAEGSWSALIGPGRAIDTDRWFVVCPNMLGSSYGSTGPGSVDPETGRRYGAEFPRITLGDIVGLQKELLDAIGVHRLAAVVGPSFGGYQAFEWATRYPAFVDRVVAAVSAPFHPPAAGSSDAVAAMLGADPGWRGGTLWRRAGRDARHADATPHRYAASLRRRGRAGAALSRARGTCGRARAAGARLGRGIRRRAACWC